MHSECLEAGRGLRPEGAGAKAGETAGWGTVPLPGPSALLFRRLAGSCGCGKGAVTRGLSPPRGPQLRRHMAMTLVQALTSEPRAPGNCRATLLPKPRELPAVEPWSPCSPLPPAWLAVWGLLWGPGPRCSCLSRRTDPLPPNDGICPQKPQWVIFSPTRAEAGGSPPMRPVVFDLLGPAQHPHPPRMTKPTVVKMTLASIC